MRTVWKGLLIWLASTIILWLGGGMGLRSSAVLSLLLAIVIHRILEVEKDLTEPKRGVLHLGFEVQLWRILPDLGVIDDSTDLGEVEALQAAPYAVFPRFRELCVWIPTADLFVWPSLHEYQSKLKLHVDIKLPAGCPLAKSWPNEIPSLYEEERYRRVTFFIEPGYPGFEFGLSVPKEFADERIKAGGFGSACIEYKEEEIYRQFRLVIGRFPSNFFGPYCSKSASFGEFEKHLRTLKSFEKNRKADFERLGWEFDDHRDYFTSFLTAKHKYTEIEIFTREE
jgi:hypothetical protein